MPAEEERARAIGSFYQALLSGVVLQWLIDPNRAPSARDLAEALRAIATRAVQTADGLGAGPAQHQPL